MDKQNVVYLYNGITIQQKKKQTNPNNKMDEPQKHYVNEVRYIRVYVI